MLIWPCYANIQCWKWNGTMGAKPEGGRCASEIFQPFNLKSFPTFGLWTTNIWPELLMKEYTPNHPHLSDRIMPVFILAKQQCNKISFRCIDNSIYLYFLKMTASKSSGMTSLVPLMQHSPSKQKPTFSRFGSKSKMVVEPPILAYLFKVWIKMGVKPHVLAWLI